MVNQKKSVPAVILSGNLGKDSGSWSLNAAALALTRSLGRHGVEVFRFHPDKYLLDLKSKYCRHVLCPNLYDDPEGLLEALARFSKDCGVKPVIYPASDGAAQFIADHESALQDHFHLTSPSAGCIARTQHKRQLIETAGALGVPVPETHFPDKNTNLEELAKSIKYPVIVKPLYSPDWKRPAITEKFGSMKALEIGSSEDLTEQCSRLIELDSEIMIQEIVEGPDKNLITFIGYLNPESEVLAGCTRKKLRQHPPKFGYCSLTESLDDREVFDLSAKLLRSLDYSGIGCVEFKRDPVTDEPKLIEINTRAVRTSMLAIGAGVDFPSIAYDDKVDPASLQPSLIGEVPVLWVHLRDELRAAGELILKRQLSFFSWIKLFRGKKIVLAEFSLDDPKPGVLLWMNTVRQIPGSKMFRKKKQ